MSMYNSKRPNPEEIRLAVAAQSKELVKLMRELSATQKKLLQEQKKTQSLAHTFGATAEESSKTTTVEANARYARLSAAVDDANKEADDLRNVVKDKEKRLVDVERRNKAAKSTIRYARKEAIALSVDLEKQTKEYAQLQAQMKHLQETRRFIQGKGSTLREAARSDDAQTIKELIEENADPNQDEDGEGRTPVFWAAQCGAVEAIRALVAHGAIVTKRARDDATAWRWRRDDPLTTACQCGQVEAARALIEASARVDIDASCQFLQGDDTWFTCTPLLAACVAGQAAVVRVLLEYDADLNVTRDDGSGPVHCAVRADRGPGHVETVEALADKKADLNLNDLDGWTPLLHAITLQCTKCVNLLLTKGARLDDALEEHPYGRDLVDAVIEDDIGLIAALLQSGTDPNLPKEEAEAVSRSATGMVCFTPLCAAVTYRRWSCVGMLLDAQADTNQRSIAFQGTTEDDSEGLVYSTPLMLAAQVGDVNIMEQLLDCGATLDMELEPSSGYTALHAAVEAGQLNSVEALLEAGSTAEALAGTRSGIALGTPADIAREMYPEIYMLLQARQEDSSQGDKEIVDG